MKSINASELKNDLSAYLMYAKAGEEIVIRESDRPIAKLVPFSAKRDPSADNRLIPMTDEETAEHERYLVVTGQMTLPKQPMDWDAFDALPKAEITGHRSVSEILENSDEWR